MAVEFPRPWPSLAEDAVNAWMHGPLHRAAERLVGTLTGQPEIRWDLRGRAAGQLQQPAGLIRLNPALFQHGLRAVMDTAVHEYAHWVVHQRWGRAARTHGPEWQALTRELGGSGDRTHRLPLPPARRHARFVYMLPLAGEVLLGPIQHRRAQERGFRYVVRRTGEVIEPGHFTGDTRL